METEVKEVKLNLNPEISEWRTGNKLVDKDLKENLSEQGQLQSLVARRLPNGELELIAGHRRYIALKALGKKPGEMDIKILENVSTIDAMLMAISENQVRQDFTAVEEGRSFASLRKLKFTVANIAKRVNRSESYVRSRLTILELPEKIQALIDEGRIELSYAEPLMKLDGFEEAQMELAKKIASKGWDSIKTVKEAEEEITRVLEAKKRREEAVAKYGACPKCEGKNISQQGWGNDKKVSCACGYSWNAETKDPWELYELKQNATRLGLELKIDGKNGSLTPKEVAAIIVERQDAIKKVDKPNPSFRSLKTVNELLEPLIAGGNVLSMSVDNDKITVKLVQESNLYFSVVGKPYKSGEKSRITVSSGWGESQDLACRMINTKEFEQSLQVKT